MQEQSKELLLILLLLLYLIIYTVPRLKSIAKAYDNIMHHKEHNVIVISKVSKNKQLLRYYFQKYYANSKNFTYSLTYQ